MRGFSSRPGRKFFHNEAESMTATIVLEWEKPLAFSGGTIYDYFSYFKWV